MTIARNQLKEIDFQEVSTGQRLSPVHPGDILLHDFINEMGLTRYKLAKLLGFQQQRRIDEICARQRGITADTALRLARLFGVDAQFWMNLQGQYELEIVEREMHKRIEREVKPLAMRAA